MRTTTHIGSGGKLGGAWVQGYRDILSIVSDCGTTAVATTPRLVRGKSMASRQNYELFDPWDYVEDEYDTVSDPFHRHSLKIMHEFYKSYGSPPAGLKVLEFGTGPVIIYEISASLYASEIVLSEYTEDNRKLLQMWLDRDPEAPDWRPFFECVVQELEGKTKEEVTTRQEELRQVIKAVIPCDIRKDTPIEPAYHGPYDVVFTCQCLECACASLEEFSGAVFKLAKLVKPGGKLVIVTMEGEGDTFFYMVGDEKFFGISIREENVTALVQQAGFHDIIVKSQSRDTPGINDPPEYTDWKTKIFVFATKNYK